MGFRPMYLYSKCSVFLGEPNSGSKPNWAKYEYHPCRSMSDQGHTLVVKQCLCKWKSLVQTPVGALCRAVGSIRNTMGQFLFLFFLLFFCFDFVPFVGDPPECKVDVAFPPTCGPPRRQGLGIQF